MAKIEINKVNLPTYWASALINADNSGLEDQDIKELDEWQANNTDLGYCAEVSEDNFFGQFNGLGTDLAEYTFIKHK